MEAMEKLYENEFISRAIVICLNDAEAVDYANELNKRCYSAKPVVSDDSEWTSLYQFTKQPNQILVMSVSFFQQMDKATFEHHLMRSQWNALISVDVPLYMMDGLMERVADAHTRGFWENETETVSEFHLLWYQN